MEMENHTSAPAILAILEEAKSNGYPALAKLKAAANISNADDIVLKHSANVIQPAIDRLEELDFYKEHLATLDLRQNRRQDEGLKRFEAVLAMTPISY
jgi:hypothetical protein